MLQQIRYGIDIGVVPLKALDLGLGRWVSWPACQLFCTRTINTISPALARLNAAAGKDQCHFSHAQTLRADFALLP